MVASEVIQLVAVYGLFVVQQFWEAHEFAWCCYLSFYKLNQGVNSYPMCCHVFPCLLDPAWASEDLIKKHWYCSWNDCSNPIEHGEWWSPIAMGCYGHIIMQLLYYIIWFIWYHIIISGSVDWKLPVLRGSARCKSTKLWVSGFDKSQRTLASGGAGTFDGTHGLQWASEKGQLCFS